MSDSALEMKIDPISTEGLEDVFLGSEGSEDGSSVGNDTSDVFGSSREVITTEEAAKRLGISARAVINRLKAGTLDGQRVDGKYRTEWRIFWEPQKTSEETSEIHIETSDHSEQSSEADKAGFRTAQKSGEAVAVLLEQNRQLIEQVNALTYRTGYLEAKLEERESTIKLLTDSHRKGSWWVRFCSWFVGR